MYTMVDDVASQIALVGSGALLAKVDIDNLLSSARTPSGQNPTRNAMGGHNIMLNPCCHSGCDQLTCIGI